MNGIDVIFDIFICVMYCIIYFQNKKMSKTIERYRTCNKYYWIALHTIGSGVSTNNVPINKDFPNVSDYARRVLKEVGKYHEKYNN